MRSLSFILGAITLVQALVTMSMLSVAVIAPAIGAALDLDPRFVGYQVGVIYVFSMASSAMAGAQVRQFGAGAVSQAALVFAGGGCLLIVTGFLPLMIAGSALIGTGYGLTNPAASHLLHRFAPAKRRNLVFSIKQTGVPLGGVAAGLVLPGLTDAAGWRIAIAGVALLGLLVALALTAARASLDDDRQGADRRRAPFIAGFLEAPRLVWNAPALRFVALYGFCLAAVQLSLMSFAVTMLVAEFGYGLIAAGAMLSAIQACGAIFRIVWGVAADRLTSLIILGVIGVVTFAGCLAMSFLGPQTHAALVVAVLLLLASAAIGWNGAFMAEVARVSPTGQVGIATGGVMVMTFCGVVVGPSLFAVLVNVFGGYAATFGAFSLFGLAGVAALVRASRVR